MKTHIFGIALLYVISQLGCFQTGEVQQNNIDKQETTPFTLIIDNLSGNDSHSHIDLRNFSQIRDVEMTRNGLLVLTNLRKSGSFTLFRQDGEIWSKIGAERFRTVPDSGRDENYFYCVDFPDGDNGWAIDSEMRVWSTGDGGGSWSQIGKIPEKSPAARCQALQFTSLQIGWMADLNGLYQTTDGGETWSTVSSISTDAGNLFFLDQSTGWVSAVDEDNNSTLYITLDGGKSWISNKTMRLPIEEISPQSSEQGLISTGKRAFVTSGAGRRFDEVSGLPDNFVTKSVYCLDSKTCYIAGYRYQDAKTSSPRQGVATLYNTLDNGKTWVQVSVKSAEPFFSKVKFFSQDVGVLVGRDTLYKTVDGGRSWFANLIIR
jgi:photosystem II stability/assembly factor-like uncharacterized protein